MTLQERIEDYQICPTVCAADAQAAVLLPDLIAAYEAAIIALEASHRERVKLREQLAQQAADWAADDTAIRELCGHVDDGYMVPLVEVVRRVVDKLAAVRAHCLKHQHSGVSPGVHLALGEVLKILEGR